MEKLNIEIITPQGSIFEGLAVSVTLPGVEGEFGVLPRHTAMVSLLSSGIIEVHVETGKVESVAIDSGYVEISASKVVVLAEGAVAIVGENDSQIATAINAAKDLLRSAQNDLMTASLEAKIETAGRSRF